MVNFLVLDAWLRRWGTPSDDALRRGSWAPARHAEGGVCSRTGQGEVSEQHALGKQQLERGLWFAPPPPPVGPGKVGGQVVGLPGVLALSAMSRATPDGSPRWPTCPFPAPLLGAGLGTSPSGALPVPVCCRACGRVVEWPSPLSLLPSGVPRSLWGFESRVIDSTASGFVSPAACV